MWREAHCLPREQCPILRSRKDIERLHDPIIILIGKYWLRKDYFKLFDGELMTKIQAHLYHENEADQ